MLARSRFLAAAAILVNVGALAGAADPPAAAPTGDPRAGEALYVGERALDNHGAPCLACHGVAGHGLARAASFGPDLTAAHASYGDDLAVMLADMPFPSMQPIYAAHVLTEAERQDLTAFLAESARREPPTLGPGYGLGIAAAAAGFLILFTAIGRRRSARRRSSSPSHGATP
jgi:mono/diheme cytochrome c family protein